MKINRKETQQWLDAPAEHFTGKARLIPLFEASAPGRTGGALVSFEPCARNDWHTHPLGQTLIVTEGVGLHQVWGGPLQEIHAGDVVTVAPAEKHWHGASPTSAMTHIAIAEALDGKVVEWLEKVTNEQYEGRK